MIISYNNCNGGGAAIGYNATTTTCPYCLQKNRPCGPSISMDIDRYCWWNPGSGQLKSCLCNFCIRELKQLNAKIVNQTIYYPETGIHRKEREELGIQ